MKANITVIVPIYNVEKYISRCLKSLMNQTYKNFQVLAVIDGSPDNSEQIAKSFSKKDSRIHVISKKNGGYGSVLEYCIKRIKTKYFIICDPDDWLTPDALSKLYYFSEKNNLDLTIGDRYNVYISNKETIPWSVKPKKLKIIKPRKVYTNRKIIQEFSLFEVSPHAKLFKTKIVKGIKFPYHVSYTDFLLYMFALSNTKRISYYNKPLAYYLLDRPGNTVTNEKPSIITEHLIVWNATVDNVLKSPFDNSFILNYLGAQLLPILSSYAKLTDHSFTDSIWKMIIQALFRFKNLKVKKVRMPFFNNFVIKQFFVKGKKIDLKARIYVDLILLKGKLKK